MALAARRRDAYTVIGQTKERVGETPGREFAVDFGAAVLRESVAQL